jgi:alpha-glucoside transport system substrate-binding protein
MTNPRHRCAALLLVLAVLSTTGLTACSSGSSNGSVTILGPWIGTEEGTEGYAFRKVLAEFTNQTGIQVNYQDTRSLSQVVLSNVRGGTPPDIAIMSSPAELAKYAQTGALFPLDEVINQEAQEAFPQPWLLRQQIDGTEHIYTVPVKASLKTMVWYNTKQAPKPIPQTWGALVAYTQSIANNKGTTPWCMGMGDSSNSGWPGTDFMESIFLHTFGPDLYRKWAYGTQPWRSPEVKEAWTLWGEIAVNQSYGGPRTALLTDFGDAGRPMFAEPQGCVLEHQSSFMTSFYQGYGGKPKPGADFDFFPFPASSSQNAGKWWEASADLAGMFNNTPQARQLMHFLATDAQRTWPTIPGSGAFTVNKNVNPSVHDDEVSKRIAGILRDAEVLCFDAAGIMPAAMRNAYQRAVLEYLNNPSQLDTLLATLDRVRAGISREDWLDLSCER